MGPQLDANHEADESQIKEVSQVISALSQNGNTVNLAHEAYTDLANIINKAMKPYEKYFNFNDKISNDDLYQYISRKFIDNVVYSDNVSLAKTLLQSFPIDIKIPFSNQNFFQLFVRDVISRMNNDFITRYYKGIGAVLNPSHGIVQLYESADGKVYKQEDITKEALNSYIPQKEKILSNDEIISNYIKQKFPDVKTTRDKIQPGDTVVEYIELPDPYTGKLQLTNNIRKLNTLAEYYKFKSEGSITDVVLKSTSTPRDLKPSDISFDINGVTYNIFDTESIKLRFALNEMRDGKFVSNNDANIINQLANHFHIDPLDPNYFSNMSKIING
jgi:hypothetical protein